MGPPSRETIEYCTLSKPSTLSTGHCMIFGVAFATDPDFFAFYDVVTLTLDGDQTNDCLDVSNH